MVLRKKDFTDLTVFEVLQNIWECVDDLENNPICKDKQWLKDYLRWNIQHLYDKWQPELPDIKIVLQGVKEQNETFYPGATCDKKTTWIFYSVVKMKPIIVTTCKKGPCIVFFFSIFLKNCILEYNGFNKGRLL